MGRLVNTSGSTLFAKVFEFAYGADRVYVSIEYKVVKSEAIAV